MAYSESVEDYLKLIYEIQQESGASRVSTSSLADRLQVSRASVTGMLKKLSDTRPRLISYQRYRGASLTDEGEKVALEIIRHHRLIESYLTQALGYSWDEVHREADRLEHVISEDLEARIAAALGEPRTDPHGSPIPDLNGSITAVEETRLSDLSEGQRAVVTRVSDHDPALLRYLEEIGLMLQARIEITERGAFEGPLFVRVLDRGTIHPLNRGVTDHVFTRPKKQLR